jgi:integration host factor subunit beta
MAGAPSGAPAIIETRVAAMEESVDLDVLKLMTKADLITEVSRAAELSKKDAENIVNVFLDGIVDALKEGEKIELRGFGSFKLRRRNSRVGRNPRTSEAVQVPAKKVPYFKPGKDLKKLINKANV